MELVFDIASSVEFWRRVYPVNRAPDCVSFRTPVSCANTVADIESLSPAWVTEAFLDPIGGRLHTMVLGTEGRRRSAIHVSHVWAGPLPEGSFYDLGDGVLIASPEFMFLASATLLGATELIAFGCELCGLYAFDKDAKRGFRKRSVPLTTVRQLGCYLQTAKGCRGFAKAQAALPHIVENSASPMETFDVLALSLPYRLGGYGLPKPIMNHEVPLSLRAARIAKRQRCFADMFYKNPKLDIEHHGRLDHSSEGDRASDRARVNALKDMGYEVIELTSDQVGDLLSFEYIISRIAKLVGRRIKTDKLGPTPARLAFRKEVFEWNRTSGRLR